MQDVNLYLRTSYHGLKSADGWYCSILEMPTQRGPVTLEVTNQEHGTANRIALTGLLKALERFSKPCALGIYTDSRHIEQGIGWLPQWKKVGWVTAKGEEIKNKDLWTRISTELERHLVKVEFAEHTEYSTWQLNRMREEARKHEQKVKGMQLQQQG